MDGTAFSSAKGHIMHRRTVASTLLLFAACLAPAQAAVPLTWKFQEGDKFYAEVSVQQKLTMASLGDVKEDQSLVASFTVRKVGSREILLEQKIESLKSGATGPAGELTSRLFKQLHGATFRITLDSRGVLERIDGVDDAVKKALEQAQVPPLTIPTFKAMLAGQLTQMTKQVFGFAPPDQAVESGAKWSQRATIGLPPMGTLSTTVEYVYEGSSGGLEKIKMTPTTTAFKAADRSAGGGAMPLYKDELKTESASGALWFDAAKGRLAQAETELRMKGKIIVPGLNPDTGSDLNLQVI
jgi:hypothetical protein